MKKHEQLAEGMKSIDERKRKYNSLKSDIVEHKEPTEEELEAYRLKKLRHDDPMAQFILNSSFLFSRKIEVFAFLCNIIINIIFSYLFK